MNFEGYASRWYVPDEALDVCLPGCFKDGLKDFLRSGKILVSHNSNLHEIGRPTSAVEDALGLRIEGELDMSRPDSRLTNELLKQGLLRGLSVSIKILDFEVVHGSKLRELWKKSGYNSTPRDRETLRLWPFYRLIKAATLYEVSLCSAPSCPGATVLSPMSLNRPFTFEIA
jgi:HK97 family phage prohead protease